MAINLIADLDCSGCLQLDLVTKLKEHTRGIKLPQHQSFFCLVILEIEILCLWDIFLRVDSKMTKSSTFYQKLFSTFGSLSGNSSQFMAIILIAKLALQCFLSAIFLCQQSEVGQTQWIMVLCNFLLIH